MMFYKKTNSKREYAKIIYCLKCVAALGTRSTECVNRQTVAPPRSLLTNTNSRVRALLQ